MPALRSTPRIIALELAGYVERFGAAHVAELLRIRTTGLPVLLEGRATPLRLTLRLWAPSPTWSAGPSWQEPYAGGDSPGFR